MEVLAAYASDDDDDVERGAVSAHVLPVYSTAPAVTASASRVDPAEGVSAAVAPSARVIFHNPRATALFAPTHGPSVSPAAARSAALRARNHRSGHVEVNYTSPAAFDMQYASFNGEGYARVFSPIHSFIFSSSS